MREILELNKISGEDYLGTPILPDVDSRARTSRDLQLSILEARDSNPLFRLTTAIETVHFTDIRTKGSRVRARPLERPHPVLLPAQQATFCQGSENINFPVGQTIFPIIPEMGNMAHCSDPNPEVRKNLCHHSLTSVVLWKRNPRLGEVLLVPHRKWTAWFLPEFSKTLK